MRSKQSGFTLVEIAIVLVIIGLLLGGVLKGQELINSAKVKNFGADFRNIPLLIYGYQDKFKALPGDDPAADTHLSGAVKASTGGTLGNGIIEGKWDSTTATEESFLFWQHVRLAGLAAGTTDISVPSAYLPKNADSGPIGITGGTTSPILTLKGNYIVCSGSILGKFAKQLDISMDDGNTATGSMQTTAGGASTLGAAAILTTNVDDATTYTVCIGF